MIRDGLGQRSVQAVVVDAGLAVAGGITWRRYDYNVILRGWLASPVVSNKTCARART
jgi:hypothetical protein